MTHHDALWATISVIASNNNKSISGLAKICLLDSTTFNPSKKYTAHGQARWISTETLAKIYIKQRKYSRALEIIQSLYLQFPEKNAYFADQIRFLEKLIINNNLK